MFCINQTIIHDYLRKGILAFVGIALIASTLPSIVPAIAETGEHIFNTETPAFPVSADSEPLYEKWVVATAYSSDPRQTDSTPCVPAMNFDMCAYYEEYGIENTIAANFLPLGTQVKFPELFGDKVFVVRDRMNARYNGTNRIDFWVGSAHPDTQEIIAAAKAKARGFGVQKIKMEVYAK